MPYSVSITRGPKVSQKSTLIDEDMGTMILPCLMLDGSGAKFSLDIHGRLDVSNKRFLDRGPQVKAYLDLTYFDLRDYVTARYEVSDVREVLEDHITVSLDDNDSKRTEKDLKIESDNSFSFNVYVCVKGSLDFFTSPRPIRFGYQVEVIWNRDKSKTQPVFFDLFLRKAPANHDAWVGLDPGTTGSCICIGSPLEGSVNEPNIQSLGSRDASSFDPKIIPSRIILPNQMPNRPIGELQPEKDYFYGYQAYQRWKMDDFGSAKFSSIKKLLGYNKGDDNKITVPLKDGTMLLSGVEIAHLLIKGLQYEIDEYVSSMQNSEAKKMCVDRKKAERIVVAIPNNYTLPKTLDMVQSIHKLGRYSEIRCIYEPEAILFNYLMKEFPSVSQKDGESIMVFDMGGATINISLFRIWVDSGNGQDPNIRVRTLGRVGYAVGGDNIDFALIETLLDLYTHSCLGCIWGLDKRLEFEIRHKNELLQHVFEFKLDFIKAANHNLQGTFSSDRNFVNFLNDMFSPIGSRLDERLLRIELEAEGIWEDCSIKLVKRILDSEYMTKYVFSRVEEAVKDMCCFYQGESSDCRLIFSGRSVLFPKIKDTVKDTLGSKFYFQEWNGLDNDEIKSAVAKGACWYGIYGGLVTLENEIITSSYGYKILRNGKKQFVPVIKAGGSFNSNGNGSSPCPEGFGTLGNVVEFYQVMGSGDDEVFDDDKRYKLNYLGYERVSSTPRQITMSIDRHDMISYKIDYTNGNSGKLISLKASSRDIQDDNDLAYVFATRQLDICECKDDAFSHEESVPAAADREMGRKKRNVSTTRI